MLFGCYRRGDANDPDTYVAAIAAVLSIYEADLVREVTDPRTGIQTTEKYMTFMPNAGELKVYCEGIAARRDRLRHLGSLPRQPAARLPPPPPPPQPGDLANVFVPNTHKRYASLVEWSKTADPRLWKVDGRPGIYVAWNVWDDGQIATRSSAARDTKPASLSLSEAALKVMADVDAERNHKLPNDQQEAAE